MRYLNQIKLIIVILLLIGSYLFSAENKSPAILLQEGIYAEQTEGDLEKAINIYRQVIQEGSETQRVVAKATYQLGMCYLKKGETEKAGEFFKKIVTDYPEQKKLVSLARKQLRKNRPADQEVVKKAVMTISTCAENDPRVAKALSTLIDVDDEVAVVELNKFLDSDKNTVRRSAIYILWKGDFKDISKVTPKLMELCSHNSELTRGMAAIALGGKKQTVSFDVLCKMTLDDKSHFARRCAAYGLGLMGKKEAKPILKKALKDKDSFVRDNAEAALTMLSISDVKKDDYLTQEQACEVNPDGTLDFKSIVRIKNETSKPITEFKFINSDFVKVASMHDEKGRELKFTVKRERDIYRYNLKLIDPVKPGEMLVFSMTGVEYGLIKPVESMDGVYRYYMRHSPSAGQPVLRIEEYLLPKGAELISTTPSHIKRSQKDGRTLLRVKEIIPANGSLVTAFQYRMPKKAWIDEPDKKDLKAKEIDTELAEKEALQAALKWLAIMDKGEYEKSWQEGAELFKKSIDSKGWKTAAMMARTPLGKLKKRTLTSKSYSNQVPGLPSGSHLVVMIFNAEYENYTKTVETVTMLLDSDEKWRVGGYLIRPGTKNNESPKKEK